MEGYEKKKLGKYYPSIESGNEMYQTIMLYLRGKGGMTSTNGCFVLGMTERMHQFFTWGAHAFTLIAANNKYCHGIQFQVKGAKHRGRVRIYYNEATDYFDVELLRARKEELVWGCSDIDCEQLHNVLHRHIETEDDPEV